MSTHNLRFEQRSGSNRCFIPYRKKLVLMSTHNLCSEKKYGKQHNFSSEKLSFLELRHKIAIINGLCGCAADLHKKFSDMQRTGFLTMTRLSRCKPSATGSAISSTDCTHKTTWFWNNHAEYTAFLRKKL